VSDAVDLDGLQQLELLGRDRSPELEAALERWLDTAPPDVDPVVLRRLDLVRAMADTAHEQVERGARTMREVREWATEHGERYLQARAECQLALLLRRAGEVTTALEHAVASLDLLPPDQPPLVRADHLLGLADALAVCGSPDAAIVRYREALRLAELADDIRMRMLVLNNLAYTYYEAGRLEDAVALCEQMQAASRAHGRQLPLHALDTLALTFVAVGRLGEAERAFAEVDLSDPATPLDVAESLLTLAGVRRQRGDLAGAADALSRSRAHAATHGLGAVEVRAMREQAELSAAEGRYAAAFEEFKAFHERQLAQHQVERDARARMLHAIFEASEARRESAKFREMSYRDALTRLWNRRYVDEQLAPLITRTMELSQPLSISFLDLDHFKHVNDTCSHEAGEEVLCTVARDLQDLADAVPGAIAARMGGEEFLLVLPGVDQARTARTVDALRRSLEGRDWRGITRGLPVTVSIGSALAPQDGQDRLQLLAAADRRLYVAKNAGRNRVVDEG
jgi:diguanylate cyclase (GGDEF)-like protein